MDSDTIDLIATRTATLLAAWIGLNPMRKSDNGDRSSYGGIAMMLGNMLPDAAPPTDATAKMAAYIKDRLTKMLVDRDGSIYMTFDVDYGPGRELAEMSDACGIKSRWPIKSHMTISAYPNRHPCIADKQGYGAEGLMHCPIDGKGWLVTPCSIDRRLIPVVVAAVEAGTLEPSVARIEAF